MARATWGRMAEARDDAEATIIGFARGDVVFARIRAKAEEIIRRELELGVFLRSGVRGQESLGGVPARIAGGAEPTSNMDQVHMRSLTRAYSNVWIVMVLALTALEAFAGRPAFAKGGWQYYDPECPIDLGSKSMKFVALQPKRTIERYCDAIPEAGPAVIALDAQDDELRDMIWDIRILRDEGKKDGEEDPNADVEFRLPAAKYTNGMVNFDHSFKKPGKYILLVETLSDGGAKKYVGRHHFTAGLWEPAEIYTFVGFGGLVLLGSGFAVRRYAAARRRPG